MVSKYFVLGCVLVQGLAVIASEGSNLRASANDLRKSNDNIQQRACSQELRKIAATVAAIPYGEFPGSTGFDRYYLQNNNPLNDRKPYSPHHFDCP